MRIRITRCPCGSIDGIQLSRFVLGQVYEVSAAVGCYLMADGYAQQVVDDSPALVVPLEWKARRYVSKPRRDLLFEAEVNDARTQRQESLAKRLAPRKRR